MSEVLYLDDLSPGMRFTNGPVTITADQIKAFAAQFDPQPRRVSSRGWRPAAGTRHRWACGCW
jgi:acyl dehydratase